jgi:D-alanine-D-alanine ligase
MGSLNRKLKVAVLMGGISSERDISLSTGKQILEALDRDKYEPFGVDAALMLGSGRTRQKSAGTRIEAVAQASEALTGSDSLASVARIAIPETSMRPDVAVIALHGKYGEDGTIQGMLELLGIPYTGSGVLASALAMDKSMAKRVLAAEGIPVPRSVDFTCSNGAWDNVSITQAVAGVGYPVIVKPSRQGSTIGMTKVNAPDELNNAINEAVAYDTRILVESFIEGTELTVSVLGNDEPFALPVIEIVPKKGSYDYEAKYTPGATDEIVPARISERDERLARDTALAAHKALSCRGMSRVDLISGSTRMYVLEVNTIPGMTPTSLLPRAAEAAGISFGRLLDMLIEYALEEPA